MWVPQGKLESMSDCIWEAAMDQYKVEIFNKIVKNESKSCKVLSSP